MKAIVKIHTGGQARRELAYCLDPNAKNKRSRVNREAILLDGDEIEQTNERVGAVYAMGVNLTALKACQIDAVVSELEQRPSQLRRRGKYTRHAVISVEPESITNEDDVNESLKKCAEDWLVSFAPKSRAVIIRHDNSRCPHVRPRKYFSVKVADYFC